MATASIEILSVGAKHFDPVRKLGLLCLDVSVPPHSDRSPSLWQSHMTANGGALVHLYDCSCKSERRWAYDILQLSDWRSFRFNPDVAAAAWQLCGDLILASPIRRIWFYSDAQWSNKPKIMSGTFLLEELRSLHDRKGIRFNTAIEVTSSGQ